MALGQNTVGSGELYGISEQLLPQNSLTDRLACEGYSNGLVIQSAAIKIDVLITIV